MVSPLTTMQVFYVQNVEDCYSPSLKQDYCIKFFLNIIIIYILLISKFVDDFFIIISIARITPFIILKLAKIIN